MSLKFKENSVMVKVTVVGAGNVGSTVASEISKKGYAEVCLIDVDEGIAKGKAIDITQQCALLGIDTKVIGSSDYRITKGSKISIITAGFPRKPGMKREELIKTNAEIAKEVTEKLLTYSPDTYIVVVTNPVDTISYLVYRLSRLPKNKIIGMGGILDTARFKYYIKEKTECSYEGIKAIVLGPHNDEMVPIVSLTTVNGKPISSILKKDEIDEIVSRTKNSGAEIVNLLKTGSAYYAPGEAVVKIVENILFDKKEILPCSVFCDGKYEISDTFLGLPVRLGAEGAEEIIDLPISDEERELLRKSAENVKTTNNMLESLKIL